MGRKAARVNASGRGGRMSRERVRAWRPHEWQRLALLLSDGAADGFG